MKESLGLAAGALMAGTVAAGCADKLHDRPVPLAQQEAQTAPQCESVEAKISKYGVSLYYNGQDQLVGIGGGIARARQVLTDPYNRLNPDPGCTREQSRVFYQGHEKARRDLEAWLYKGTTEAQVYTKPKPPHDASRYLFAAIPSSEYGYMNPNELGDYADGKTVDTGITAIRRAFTDNLGMALAISDCAMDAAAVCGASAVELRTEKLDEEIHIGYLRSAQFNHNNVTWLTYVHHPEGRGTVPLDQQAVCDRAFALCLDGTAKAPQHSQAAKDAARMKAQR